MQKWRPWEAASDTEWGLALEREAVIRWRRRVSGGPRRCGGVSCQGCTSDIASAGRIRHIVRLRSSASQGYVQRLLASSDWLIAQQWLPSDRPHVAVNFVRGLSANRRLCPGFECHKWPSGQLSGISVQGDTGGQTRGRWPPKAMGSS